MTKRNDRKRNGAVFFPDVETISLHEDEVQESNLPLSQGEDGSVFVGDLEGLVRHGEGSVFSPTGDILCGTFHHNIFRDGILLHDSQYVSFADGEPSKETSILSLSDRTVVFVAYFSAQRFLQTLAGCARSVVRLRDSYSRFISSLFQREKNEPFNDSFEQLYSTEASVLRVDRNTLVSNFSLRDSSRNIDLREEVAHTTSEEAFFACASPVSTESLSFYRFFKRLFLFLFPYFALPGFFCAPCEIDASDIEREFVVSGASLQRSFNSPTTSMYAISLGLAATVSGILLFYLEKKEWGSFCAGSISEYELFSPLPLWFLCGVETATYFGYRRMPHGLEHMNRELTAELTALAANVVDSKSKVCIYTWDETGKDKEKNKWIRVKWLIISLFSSLAIGWQGVFLRRALHFTSKKISFKSDYYLFFIIAGMCCFSFLITYYSLKNLDVQREVLSKLRVLTRIAYIEGKCVVEPCTSSRVHFSCDLPLDIKNLKTGFSGWFTTRSLVLCASPVANHNSRGGVMSIFVCYSLLHATMLIGKGINALFGFTKCDYTYLFSHDLVILLIWGTISILYIGVCLSVQAEQKRHLNIMDVVSLYHQFHRKSVSASNIIEACRQMTDSHDIKPTFFHITLGPFLSSFFIFWIFLGMVVSVALFLAALLTSNEGI